MAVVPTPFDWTDGVVFTAAQGDAGIRDVGIFSLAPPIFRGRQTSAQSIPNNAFTAVTFDAEDVDSAGGHSTVSNTSRYTAVYAGWYQVSGGVGFAGNATGNRAAYLKVNGTVINGSQSNIPNLGAGSTAQVVISAELVFLNVGDFVELFAFQNSGGALNTAVAADNQPRMNVVWVSN